MSDAPELTRLQAIVLEYAMGASYEEIGRTLEAMRASNKLLDRLGYPTELGRSALEAYRRKQADDLRQRTIEHCKAAVMGWFIEEYTNLAEATESAENCHDAIDEHFRRWVTPL